eukprot:scaffold949_cov160-Skeletonema_dohrnii-CCMP3373.AAC.4
MDEEEDRCRYLATRHSDFGLGQSSGHSRSGRESQPFKKGPAKRDHGLDKYAPSRRYKTRSEIVEENSASW